MARTAQRPPGRTRIRVFRLLFVAAALATGAALASCTATTAEPRPSTAAAVPAPAGAPAGEGTVQVEGLTAPWSMAALADHTILVSERDTGQVVEVSASGAKHLVGVVPGVVHQGEGGLLGLAVRLGGCADNPSPDPHTGCLDLYAYLTTETDNRVVRMPLTGSAGTRSLGADTVIVQGIPKASNHNGGRIAFGPDGMLYVGTGDAGNGANAQSRSSLSGKILRLGPDGSIPAGNPFPDSPVWSMGHRNVQGMAWDGQGRMWASEFGQDTWDELNQIKAGGNYGWPVVEGIGGADLAQFTNPVLVWRPDEASPSGIAVNGTTLYMAALRGERLWVVDLAGTPKAHAVLVGGLGRLRDVTLTQDRRLYVLTNNTDGRGDPRPGDDKIVDVTR